MGCVVVVSEWKRISALCPSIFASGFLPFIFYNTWTYFSCFLESLEET